MPPESVPAAPERASPPAPPPPSAPSGRVKSLPAQAPALRLVASGKVKDVYEAGPGLLRFRFSDRISAYDVKFAGGVPRKGEVLCAFAEYWFGRLGEPSHFVERASPTDMVVRRLDMLPIECVVRGYLYGSLYERVARGQAELPAGAEDGRMAARLPSPVFDPTTKAEHDEPVGRAEAVGGGLVTGPEYDELAAASIRVYGEMAGAADAAGFVLADLKLEFGRLPGGRIVLGDSIGPDEFRLWPRSSYSPGSVQAAYDKQILRDWLSENGYKRRFDEERAAGREPVPPAIPTEIASRITARYVEAYERLTGRGL